MQLKMKTLVVLAILMGTETLSQSRIDPIQLIKDKIDSTVESNNVPAVSVAIVREAIVLQNLLQENKIQLDQPITDFFPNTFNPKKEKELSQITIEKILHHHAGLPRVTNSAYKRKDGDPYEYDYKAEDFITDLKKIKLRKEAFRYSNFGYGLLAHVAERATNKSFSELLNTYLIEPYELNSTSLELGELGQSVTPYRKDDRNVETKPWRMGKMTPPSAIYSNIKDLSKLMRIQINAYNKQDQETNSPLILSNNTRLLGPESTVSYGYGLFVGQSGTYGHGGDNDGFGCEYSFSVVDNYGIVLLTSSGGLWIPELYKEINQILKDAIKLD